MKRGFPVTIKITVTAFCTAINIVGAYVALALRLPIYLDSIGTILDSVLLGPAFDDGRLPERHFQRRYL